MHVSDHGADVSGLVWLAVLWLGFFDLVEEGLDLVGPVVGVALVDGVYALGGR